MNAAAVVLSPANPSDTAFPSLIVDGGPGVSDQTDSQQAVGQNRVISIRELERHAADCHWLMQLSKARYRGSKSLEDASEAARWATLKEHAQNAILAARRERLSADELTMAGEWTTSV